MNLLTPIKEIMTPNPIVERETNTLQTASEKMTHYEIHHLPVVDGDARLIGMVSRSDLIKAQGDYSKAVHEVMVRGLAKLEPTDTVRTAVHLFSLNKFHALPVVEGERLVGIVTTHDVIALLDRETVKLKDYK